MTTLELICWAEERHVHYCQLGDKFLQEIGKCFNRPGFKLFANKTQTCAWARYSKELCDYNLSFLLATEEKFEQTIAHEVAHFVVKQIGIDAKPHGDLFMFILRDVFNMKSERYANYSRGQKHIIQAIALMKLVKLNETKLKDAAERSSS